MMSVFPLEMAAAAVSGVRKPGVDNGLVADRGFESRSPASKFILAIGGECCRRVFVGTLGPLK
jgi:hypothetical protein